MALKIPCLATCSWAAEAQERLATQPGARRASCSAPANGKSSFRISARSSARSSVRCSGSFLLSALSPSGGASTASSDRGSPLVSHPHTARSSRALVARETYAAFLTRRHRAGAPLPKSSCNIRRPRFNASAESQGRGREENGEWLSSRERDQEEDSEWFWPRGAAQPMRVRCTAPQGENPAPTSLWLF